MNDISIREISSANWHDTLELNVQPDQQRFVAGYAPISALVLAKAYVRSEGLTWTPYAIYAGEQAIGIFALAYRQESVRSCWLRHFFIDKNYQGRGFGSAALRHLLAHLRTERPQCTELNLTVHPENSRAQKLYEGAGFMDTGQQVDGEPIYQCLIHEEAIADETAHNLFFEVYTNDLLVGESTR